MVVIFDYCPGIDCPVLEFVAKEVIPYYIDEGLDNGVKQKQAEKFR